MKIAHRPADEADIRAVLAAPSAITRAEIDAFGDTIAGWRDAMADALYEGEGIAIEAGYPLAVAVHRERRPGTRTIRFVHTEDYWRTGMAGVRYSRAVMLSLLKRFPADRFLITTRSPHPQVRRWLAIIGFREVGTMIFEASHVR